MLRTFITHACLTGTLPPVFGSHRASVLTAPFVTWRRIEDDPTATAASDVAGIGSGEHCIPLVVSRDYWHVLSINPLPFRIDVVNPLLIGASHEPFSHQLLNLAVVAPLLTLLLIPCKSLSHDSRLLG